MVALRRDDEVTRPAPPHAAEDQDERPVRRGMLPEETAYDDTGCDLAPACLKCPFDKCQYDLASRAGVVELIAKRDREIARLHRYHRAPVTMLSEAYGLSRRTIFRILREQGGGRVPKRRRRRPQA